MWKVQTLQQWGLSTCAAVPEKHSECQFLIANALCTIFSTDYMWRSYVWEALFTLCSCIHTLVLERHNFVELLTATSFYSWSIRGRTRGIGLWERTGSFLKPLPPFPLLVSELVACRELSALPSPVLAAGDLGKHTRGKSQQGCIFQVKVWSKCKCTVKTIIEVWRECL